jgi:hypothetical protein
VRFNAVIASAVVLAAASIGAYLYFVVVLGKQAFDPQAVSTEIVHTIGASVATNPLFTSTVCRAVEYRVCMGHTRPPREVRDVVDRVIGATNATPTREWSADTLGYSRIYRFDDYRIFSIIITAEMIGMHW